MSKIEAAYLHKNIIEKHTIKDNQTKTYCSRKDNIEQYFEVKYGIESTFIDLTIIEFKIRVEINYLFQRILSQNYLLANSRVGKSIMKFSLANGVFTVDDIVIGVKSMGIGTVVLRDVFELAKKDIPTKPVYFKMSAKDEENAINKKRRNSLYEKFGLVKLDEAYGATNVENVKTKDMIIIADEVKLKTIIQDRNNIKESLAKSNKDKTRIFTSYEALKQKNIILHNKNTKLIFLLVAFGLFAITYFLSLR